jgi:hypothetical protein
MERAQSEQTTLVMKAQPESHWPRFHLSGRLSEDRVAIFRSDSESLSQGFEAIRHRALLRYRVCKMGEH